jgi:hypothetical protein
VREWPEPMIQALRCLVPAMTIAQLSRACQLQSPTSQSRGLQLARTMERIMEYRFSREAGAELALADKYKSPSTQDEKRQRGRPVRPGKK